MKLYLSQYILIFFYFLFALLLAFIFFFVSFCFITQKGYSEKLSPYECGFEPFNDARSSFDIRFYLVAILFIIFDLEISFLFPWCVCLGKLPRFAFWSMLVFLLLLTVGFIYEWKKGALEWE